MIYTYKGYKFSYNGKSLIPDDDKPTKECWDAYHEFILLPKKEQNEHCKAKD
jgi:hypothetical protein